MSSRWISIPFASPLSRSQPLINLGSSKLVARTWGSCQPVGSLKLGRPTANACRNIYSSNYLSIWICLPVTYVSLNLSMQLCVDFHVYPSVCAQMSTLATYTYICMYIYLVRGKCIYIYVYVYVRANICAYTYARIYVCIYADAYIAFTMLTRVCNVYAHKNINK